MQDRKKQDQSMRTAYSPTGHRILVLLDDIELINQTESGVIIATGGLKEKEQNAHMGATVIKMGPTCYNLEHMGKEPWCQEGDRITIAPFSGKGGYGHPRLKMINDEDVTGVEDDPENGVALLLERIEAADNRFADIVTKAKQKLAEVSCG